MNASLDLTELERRAQMFAKATVKMKETASRMFVDNLRVGALAALLESTVRRSLNLPTLLEELLHLSFLLSSSYYLSG